MRKTPSSPKQTNVSAPQWCLRVVVAVQSVGVGGRYLLGQNEFESHIYGWLYFDLQWPETVAQRIDDLGSLLCLLAAALLWVGAGLQFSRSDEPVARPRAAWGRWIEGTSALVIAAWMLALALTEMMRASVYAELMLAEHAVRFGAPLALCLIVAGKRLAMPLVALATAATFAAHGYKATQFYGPFTDLILLSDQRWTQLGITQSTAEKGLLVIGLLDILAAILLLATRYRAVAIYMAVWGFVTAASRMTALDASAWPETLLRAANGGAPLSILLYWQHMITRNRLPQSEEA